MIDSKTVSENEITVRYEVEGDLVSAVYIPSNGLGYIGQVALSNYLDLTVAKDAARSLAEARETCRETP